MPKTQTVLVAHASPETIARYKAAMERKTRAAGKAMRLYYNDPVAFAHDCFDWGESGGLATYQEEVLAALPEHFRVSQRGPRGMGKALAVATVIPTPTGSTTMGQLQIGDSVLDEQGQSCQVTWISPTWTSDTWRVSFADGTQIVTHGEHEWQVIDKKSWITGAADWRDHWHRTKTRTTRQMAEQGLLVGKERRWRVPTAQPIQGAVARLPIDPYVLGVWLGDGHTDNARLTCADQEIVDHIQAAGESCRPCAGSYAWSLSDGVQPGARPKPESFRSRLRALGLLGYKHIPMEYLRASERQRRSLLQGLMDTDGFNMSGAQGSTGIDLSNKQLAGDVAKLIQSLGLVCRVREEDATLNGRVVGRRWRINFRADECPFQLTRKVENWTPRGSQASRHTHRPIVAIERIADEQTVCIEVDSPSHLFLATEAMVPTHNSTTHAIALLWFALTRNAQGIDWKCPTTAGGWHQLEEYLWPEVHKWANRIRWEKLGRAPFRRGQLLKLSLKLEHGSAFAVASDVPERIEGAHADALMFLYDESKIISDETFDAAEGSLSGMGENFAFASSTPGAPAGRFYDIHAQIPGLQSWWTRHITMEETIKAGRMNPVWAEEHRLLWGEDSALYYNHVLGEFRADDESAVIPLAWVEAAVARWHESNLELAKHHPMVEGRIVLTGLIDRVGVDVAESGGDKTVQSLWVGDRCHQLRVTSNEDTVITASRVGGVLTANPNATAVIDADGIGVGVYNDLKHEGHKVEAFHASAATEKKDASGELGFINVRAAAWWTLREQLDPRNGSTLELPPDDTLVGDLTAPKYEMSGRSKIKVESKKEIKKRLHRSPDAGDAVMMARWQDRKRKRRMMGYAGRVTDEELAAAEAEESSGGDAA